jgi:DNA processing protein
LTKSNISVSEKPYYVGFNLVKGIGAVRMQALRNFFGNLASAWQAPADALKASGLGPKLVDKVIQVRNEVDLDQYLDRINKQNIEIITMEDELFPSLLKEIDHPPPVLFMRGRIQPEDRWAVAVVGTRRVSTYGRQVTEEVVSWLAINHMTIISGLARGVDAIAHKAALDNGGRTIAVLGSGVDRIYPPEHKKLADEILENGALISDYAPGTPPDASNFPPRNRIISGLSLATVVVEAGETSGALITAQFALEQGREVFAVPGNILAPQTKGTNHLISEGAHPLLSGRDILEVLNLSAVGEKQQTRKILPDNDVEKSLLGALDLEPLHIDEIQEKTGLPIEQVSATLTMMELKGMVRQVSGSVFLALRDAQGDYEA